VLTSSAVTAAETAVTGGIAGNIMMITAMVTGPAAGFTGPIKAITVAALRTPVTVMHFKWIRRLHHKNVAAAAAAAASAAVVVVVVGVGAVSQVSGIGLQLYQVIRCLLKVMKRKD
jgi:hypothetical protein